MKVGRLLLRLVVGAAVQRGTERACNVAEMSEMGGGGEGEGEGGLWWLEAGSDDGKVRIKLMKRTSRLEKRERR
jgi:hypothetical protein